MPRPKADPRTRTNEPLPYVLTPGELRALVGLGASRFAALQRAGAFRDLQLDAIDGVTRYSGALVEAWVRGGRVATRSRFVRSGSRRSHGLKVPAIA